MEGPAQPRGPRRLTRSEIEGQRAQRRAERKVRRIALKAANAAMYSAMFPHRVTLRTKGKLDEAGKHELRSWFLAQNMRPYHTQSDASQKADVMWDSEWKTFMFKNQWHATMFSMVWLKT